MILHLALLAALQQQSPSVTPDKSYLFFVASEGSDEVALMRFDAKGIRVEHRTMFKLVPGDIESPGEIYTPKYRMFDSLAPVRNIGLSSAHGIASSATMTGPRNLTIGPDGRSYYVTTARGFPATELLFVRIAADSSAVPQPSDTVQGQEILGSLPGAVQITRDGAFAWVTNTTSPADSQPSWVSIVYLRTMVEAGRIQTCAGAHGSRFSPDGAFHYSLCAANDALVEIDAIGMKLARQLDLSGPGRRHCAPISLTMVADGSRIFVACEQSDEIVEVDRRSWAVTRRLALGTRPADLASTSDGRTLVVVQSASQTVLLVDVGGKAGQESEKSAAVRAPGLVVTPDYQRAYLSAAGSNDSPARVEIFNVAAMMVAAAFVTGPSHVDNSGAIAALDAIHGAPASVAVSSDDRYAFISFARSAAEPGSVVVIDLSRRVVAASIDFGRSLSGIAFWKLSK